VGHLSSNDGRRKRPLLAIKLGGQGDMTDSAVRWRYTRPVPQVPVRRCSIRACFLWSMTAAY
jgi:hypothetical protein